jgi:hypothetical protein
MKNLLFFFLLIIFSASCHTAKPVSVEQTEPEIESTPLLKREILELTTEQIMQLDERISPEIRKVLENAKEFEIKTLKIVGLAFKTEKKAVIKDKKLMNRLKSAIFYDVATSPGKMACYTPRHNLYAKSGKEWVNLEICYECATLVGEFSGKRFSTPINDTFSKEIFDQILQNAASNK